MPRTDPPLEAVDEIRQLNALFLGFLRELPPAEALRFGLSRAAVAAVQCAVEEEIGRAASFPRALFRIRLPISPASATVAAAPVSASSREQVLKLVLLHSARSLSRMSGYWARLLLWLGDDEVDRLRGADVDEIVAVSRMEAVVGAAFDELDWIWQQLLTESRPEYRRRLLLIGFQPDVSLQPVLAMA